MANTSSDSRKKQGDDLYKKLWKACAGPLLEFPLTGDRVYYFPQGHLEQLEPSTNDEVNQPGYDLPSKILCRVINIQLRAEQDTDDVYAQITLLAEADQTEPRNVDPSPAESPRANVHSFCKVLTASDMSSRYGLCVPRKHATECLAPLDMSRETPAQELVAKDLHGNEWHFKHTFRGRERKATQKPDNVVTETEVVDDCNLMNLSQPPRHLLTKGWSAFVSSKRLIAGDTVIFLSGEDGDMRIGVKHVARPESSTSSTGISSQNKHQELLAVICHAFHVGTLFSIYCKPRLSQFIITLNKYLEALTKKFCIGMRIKMRFEVQHSSEKRFTGTIVEIGDICHERWPNSEWRCLKIRWYGPAPITRPERVSPWEIEPLVNLVSRSLIQIGGTQIYNEMPQPLLKRGKRKLRGEPKEQVMEGLDIVASSRPQPNLYERFDGMCPSTIEGFLELGPEEGIQEENVMPSNQMSDSTIQDETQPQPQGTFTNQAPISDINYKDQLGYIHSLDIPNFTSPDNTLASEGNDAWITNLFEGIDQDEHEAEREISTLLWPLPENTCHMPLQGKLPLPSQPGSSNISHISSTCLIPYNGPDLGDELVPWARYSALRRCIPILDRIIARYPELLSSFRLTSNVFQSMSLQILAEVVYMLEHLTIGSINQEQLDDSKRNLNDLKMNGIQVDWIEKRLLLIDAVFKKATLVQHHEKLIQEVESVDKELEEVTSVIDTNPLNADQSVMEGLL